LHAAGGLPDLATLLDVGAGVDDRTILRDHCSGIGGAAREDLASCHSSTEKEETSKMARTSHSFRVLLMSDSIIDGTWSTT